MSDRADFGSGLCQTAYAVAATVGTVVWVPFFMVFETIHHAIYGEYLSFSPCELYSHAKGTLHDVWN